MNSAPDEFLFTLAAQIKTASDTMFVVHSIVTAVAIILFVVLVIAEVVNLYD